MKAPAVEPASGLAEAGHRLVMAGGAVRLAPRRDHVTRSIATALRKAALGREATAERQWLERIEARRALLPRELASASADTGSSNPTEALDGATGICALISVPRAWGRFLFHLVRTLAPRSCLEVGTGIGISATYQAAALELNGAGGLITVDTTEHARAAERSFAELGLSPRASLVVDAPGEGIARAIERGGPFGLVLLDADHTENGTVRDFDAIAPHLSDGAVIVVDDIGWTDEMRRAWKTIRDRPQVEYALALQRFGILAMSGSRRD